MKNQKRVSTILVFLVGIIAIYSCTTSYQFRSNYKNANKLLHDSRNLETKLFLKAHIKNGDICILRDTWNVDTVQKVISGIGTRYNFNRNVSFAGNISVPIDSVAIFETNKKLVGTESDRIAALSIITALDIGVGIYCLTNPKACFGSCPTFYMNEFNNFHYADAEGFSNAIAPSLESSDIDALNNKPISNHAFALTMKNEALETHCVKNVQIWAYPRKRRERIYHSPADDFYLCENIHELNKATGNEGDITKLLSDDDRQERFSLSAPDNLSSKEEIYLNFDDVKNVRDLGLIIHFRQTLMTTYIVYSAIGFMGDEVGDIFAKIEKAGDKISGGIYKELGEIEVHAWNEQTNKWEFQGRFYEIGPIAINKQMLPLKSVSPNSNVRLKLVLNKGLWRIDYVALTNIKEKVNPIKISPSFVLNKGKLDNSVLTTLNQPDKYLISMPGSEYKFIFNLPKENDDYELFLYSRGYYLEWMREHWLQDKNLSQLSLMIENPKKYLLTEAEDYKRYETTMEQEFWNSKIDTKIFSYYEK